MKKTLTLACFALLSLASFGQTQRVLFQGGTYSYDVSGELISTKSFQTEQDYHQVVRLMVTSDILSNAAKARLATEGIDIIGYVPFNAYIVTAPKGYPTAAIQEGAIAYIPLATNMKLSSQLASGNVPDYTWDDNMWLLYAESANLSMKPHVLKALDRLGITYEDGENRGIHIRCAPERLHDIAAIPGVVWIQQREAPGEPENHVGTKNHRSNAVRVPYAGGRQYDGTGVAVGHGDDGDIVPHMDFKGRILHNRSAPSLGNHGDHVAGTVLGAGNIDPNAEGQAPGASLVYSSYPANLSNTDSDYVDYGVRVTVSSYSNGCNAGYTAFARQVDEDIRDNTALNHVFSAGNNGASNCGYGAGNGWGNITGGHKQGKNVITVANLTGTDGLAASSSRGPAHDGRIKPDVGALGTQVYSCSSPNGYTYMTGTSMACPGVGGVMAQLVDAYRDNHNGNDAPGGLLKAILMNTADDLGNPGPDYKHGYGRVNTLRAVQVIENEDFIGDSLSQGQTDTVTITVPSGSTGLRVMLHWTDPQATVNAQRALVNDLNGTLTSGSSSWLPWVLDPTATATALNSHAVRAVDSLNNTEQFTLTNPAPGDYNLIINGSVINGPQAYWVTYWIDGQSVELTYPVGGEVLEPASTYTARWNAGPGTTGFTLEYSGNGGNNWNTAATATANQRMVSFMTPANAGDNMMYRLSRGTQSDTTDARLGRVGIPSNITVNWACPDSMNLSWTGVTGASDYVIYVLGAKYMEAIDTITGVSGNIYNINPGVEQWISVAALTPNGMVGQRAYAVQKLPGLVNCTLQTDVDLVSITGPSGSIPSCVGLSALPISVQLSNGGSDTIASIPLGYQLNAGTIQQDTVAATIFPGQSATVTLNDSLNISLGSSYHLNIWTELNGDQFLGNDSAQSQFSAVTSTTVTLPYSQTFFNFSTCGTFSNCGNTTCTLSGGWTNASGLEDDHDWRVNTGGTPSSGTGPSAGYSGGNDPYLYLEASGGCTYQEAILTSPCIDLTNATLPQLTFWSHMYGSSMGELHVDILSGGQWYLDVMPAKMGNQGNAWQQSTINLLPYSGQVIQIRFRGITGSSWQSDIAIDDINVTQVTSAPVVNFSTSNTQPCLGQFVFLTDLSSNSPSQWQWQITPSTGVSYHNGTNAASQNPIVSFSSYGTYDVTLIATNTNGSDTLIQSGLITMSQGTSLPFNEDFQSFVPAGWEVINPDGSYTWVQGTATGPNGNSTQAATINNYNYNSSGAEDYLVTESIWLNSGQSHWLTFDVAYVQYASNYADGLRVDVSSDCGNTWQSTGYLKIGSVLSTAPNYANNFVPNSASQWRQDSIFLDSTISGTVKFRFAAINDYGNNLYIDNVNLFNPSITAPIATASHNATGNDCAGDTITFNGLTQPSATAQWNFGANAIPATASGFGPHQVVYTAGGNYQATLTVNNSGGSDSDTLSLSMGHLPQASGTYSISQQTVTFTNTSSPAIDQYYWDFGDGTTDTTAHPVHNYPNGDTITVTMAAHNACGWDTTTFTFYVSGVGLNEIGLDQLQIHPNPTSGKVTLDIPSSIHVTGLRVLDMLGREVMRFPNPSRLKHLDLSALPSGRYLVEVRTEDDHVTRSVIKH